MKRPVFSGRVSGFVHGAGVVMTRRYYVAVYIHNSVVLEECTHRHRKEHAAWACAKRMSRKARKRSRRL